MAQKPAESIIEMDELNKAVEAINFEVLDPALKVTFNLFINKIEEQERLIKQLQLKNQQLQDENNRLKGEQGKPDIRPQTSSKDISSEAERKLPNQEKTKNSKAKNHKIKICGAPFGLDRI